MRCKTFVLSVLLLFNEAKYWEKKNTRGTEFTLQLNLAWDSRFDIIDINYVKFLSTCKNTYKEKDILN